MHKNYRNNALKQIIIIGTILKKKKTAWKIIMTRNMNENN